MNIRCLNKIVSYNFIIVIKELQDEVVCFKSGSATIVDLFNREIIGYSAGCNKTADLVKQAFQSVKGNLKDIQIFHTDRGNEFKNHTIDEALKAFEIQSSLSHKGCPYDNAVSEATFKIIKTEFVRNQTFSS